MLSFIRAICFLFSGTAVFLSFNIHYVKRTFALALLILIFSACRKERVTTDPAALLSTSTDTLRFDTVFTTTGSITRTFKLFNPNKEGIRLASVRLMGGAASPFKINVNGTPGPAVENLELAGGDSAYVFVTVVIPSTSVDTLFIVQDSIEIAYNGNKKTMQLEALGQNAHLLRNHSITGTEVWKADKPYVLSGEFIIEQNAHLTITEGCKIYAHANAPFIVKGRLTVQGRQWDSTKVLFTGDRLDEPYRELPGSWPGILFKASSHDNTIQYAVIKNAYRAIAAEASPVLNKLHLNETIISNAYDAGILAVNTNITAQNIVVSNCGKAVVLRDGGTYHFTHATVAGFSTMYLPHKEPVLFISTAAGNSNDLNAVFRNCIFWGESGGLVADEVAVDKKGSGAFKLLFDGVLWPLAAVPDGASITIPPIIAYPEFDSINVEKNFYDFHLKETSPARNSGVPAGVSLDLDGRPRPALKPDLGAYEKQ